MPLTPRVERIRTRVRPWARLRARLLRERAFAEAAVRHFGARLSLLVGLLIGGGALIHEYTPGQPLNFVESVYQMYSLVIGQPPETLPKHWIPEVLCFAMPVLGLTVLIESVVEFAQILKDRRKHERAWCKIMAKSLSGHVVLVGLGRLGWRTYRALHRLGIPLVVIDVDERSQFLEGVRRDGTALLIGDARHEAILTEAGIERARAIVVATNDDLVNLEVALDARQKHPGIRVVLRMFDQNMADKVHSGFDLKATLSTTALAAPTFAAAAVVGNVVATTVLDDELLLTVAWTLTQDDRFTGKSVGEVMEHHSVVVLRVSSAERGARLFPPPSEVLRLGDALVVQGRYDDLVGLAMTVG